MKINQHVTGIRARWLKNPVQSHPYRTWLIEADSLTARLQKRYADFRVQAVRVSAQKPSHEEADLLHVAVRENAQIREVLLFGNAKAVVFAHSVLPYKSLRGAWRSLGRLGNKPLGAVLFANPNVKRTPLAYKKLSLNHSLYQAAIKHLSEKPDYLWARRSIFSLNCASIMVVEIFLPALIKS
ncbi:MAG: chorismate lyase [Methylotenera sp.]